jgi:hypothetical protein
VKIVTAGAFVLATLLATSLAGAQSRVEVGQLNCNVEGGGGFIFGSTKAVACVFERTDGGVEYYGGEINKWGLEIGSTSQTLMSWLVLAATNVFPAGALQGSYGGISAEATVGVGLGANVLVGGSDQSFALQPVSLQTQQGLNIAAGIAQLNLRLQ